MRYVKPRVGKYVIVVYKKSSEWLTMHFTAVRKSRKRYGFVIFSYLKDRLSVFTAVKRDAKC